MEADRQRHAYGGDRAPIVACDASGRVLYGNLAARQLLHRHNTASLDLLLPSDHANLASVCIKEGKRLAAATHFDGHYIHWTYRRLPRRQLACVFGNPVDASVVRALSAAKLMESILGKVGFGLLAIDAEFAIQFANPIARACLESAWPGSTESGRLFQNQPRLRSELDHLLQRDGGAVAFHRGVADAPLEILVTPLAGECNTSSNEASVWLIGVVDPDFVPSSFPKRLADLYDLTPAEARVAAVLKHGRSLSDTAEVIGVSRSTVSTHLRTLCKKTGTAKMSDLLCRINCSIAAIMVAVDLISDLTDLTK